jgi:hypothetical protein
MLDIQNLEASPVITIDEYMEDPERELPQS